MTATDGTNRQTSRQTDRQTDGQGGSLKESAQWGRFSENYTFDGKLLRDMVGQ